MARHPDPSGAADAASYAATVRTPTGLRRLDLELAALGRHPDLRRALRRT